LRWKLNLIQLLKLKNRYGRKNYKKEGKKLIIEITVDLEDSMLDGEEAIQAVVNKAGSLATKEALKQFDTEGEAIKIEGKQW
jgi:hypothetical protein